MTEAAPLLAGRFRPVRPLGEGGMGSVVEVEDTWSPGRRLALKRIHPEGGMGEALALRLKEEFHALARLRHPNLVGVVDYGPLEDGRSYLAMELVEGPGLDQLVAAGPLAPEAAAPLLEALLQALDFIHSRGYVHRDLKPANLKLDAEGQLKVLDFGLLIPLGAQTASEASVGLSGSLAYLPPEAIAQAPLGPAADLYAVGCLAFELLTGRPPFTGKPMEVLRGHMHQRPPSLLEVGLGLPTRWEPWLQALLAKDPTQRPASAEAARAWLVAIAGGHGLSRAQRASYVEPAQLIGREDEWGALLLRLEAAARLEGSGLLLLAPAGAGKSRLMRELELKAKLNDLAVTRAQCSSDASPMAPLAEALRPWAVAPGVLDGHGALAATLWPELAPAEAQPLEDLELLLEAWGVWCLATLGGRPRLWLLEDAHLADPATQACWLHLLALAPEQGWAMVASARPDALSPAERLGQALAEGELEAIRPRPFRREEVESWVRAALHPVAISEESLEALHQATGGNAFHLSSLLRHLIEEGTVAIADGVWRFPEGASALQLPGDFRDTLLARLGRLSPGARTLAEAMAILGGHADLPLAMAIVQLDEDEALEAMAELEAAHLLLRLGEGRLAFPHASLRELLAEELAPGWRAALHQAAGEALERRQAEGHEVDPMALARHFRAGLDPWKAHLALRLAGDIAQERGAEVLALRLWEEALEALGRVEGLPPGQVAEAQRELRWALGLSAFILAPTVAVRALADWVPSLPPPGPGLPPGAPNALDGFSFLGIAQGYAGQVEAALAANDQALALCPEGEGPDRGALLVGRCAALYSAGRWDEAIALGRRAEGLLWAELGPEPNGVWLAARVGCLAVQLWGAFQGLSPSAELVARAQAAALALGDREPFTISEAQGVHAALAGRVAGVEAYLDAVSAKCRRMGAPPYPMALVLRAMAWRLRGAQAEARAAVAWARAQAHWGERALPAAWLDLIEAKLRVDAGEGEPAWEALLAAQAQAKALALGFVAQRASLALAEAALGAGRPEDSAGHAQEALGAAREGPWRNPLHAAGAHRLLAQALGAMGRLDEALASLEAGQGALAGLDAPLEAALLAQAWGAVWALKGRRGEALEAYAQAEEGFGALGLGRQQHEVAQAVARTKALLAPKRQMGLGLQRPRPPMA